MSNVFRATAEANPNIAIVKYWGNRDDKLILPSAGSISVTLDNQFKTRTTAMFSEQFKKDEIWINGKQLIDPEDLEKIMKQIDFYHIEADDDSLKVRIVSESSMPISAGLSSSSSGLCASAYAMSSALDEYNDWRIALGTVRPTEELSIASRLGSGSACRSVHGGFVEWKIGEKQYGSDSCGYQITDENSWPEFRIIIGIIDEKEKKVKSRIGMTNTTKTSILYPERLRYLPETLKDAKRAIINKDYQRLFRIAIRDSNNMHAVMMDTYPPLMYLNDISKEVIYRIHDFNGDEIKAGYSFDAGPNPAIFTLEKYENIIKDILMDIGIEKIFISKLGGSPKILKEEKDHLIDEHGNIK